MKHQLAALTRQIDAKSLDRIALLVAALLVILLARSLAELTWTLLPGPEQAAPPPIKAAAAPRDAPDYRRLASLHLFGEAAAPATAAPVDAPDTRLNLTLRGILYNSVAEFARAIISAPGRPDEMYRVGDEVPGGAHIDQIYADRVILQRGGRHETLRLPEDRLDAPVSAGVRSAGSTAASPHLPSGSASVLSEYRRQLIENPQDAGQFIQAAPVPRSSGGIAGFRVEPGSDPAMFEMAGLQPGDIVTSVNGVRLDSLDRGFDAMEQLAASEQVTLTVLRNGQELQLQLQLSNLQ